MVCLVLCACAPTPAPAPPTPLQRAAAREVPGPLRARGELHLRSAALGVGVRSDMVVLLDRPGRGHLGLLNPLGTPRTTVQVDGAGLALRVARDRTQFVARDADRVLRDATRSWIGLDDLLGLAVAELPLPPAPPHTDASGTIGAYDGPRDLKVALEVDPRGTPRSVVATDPRGVTLVAATWTDFVPGPDGVLLPTRISMRLTELDLDLQLTVRGWDQPEVSEAAFSLVAPADWDVQPLEAVGRAALSAAVAALLDAEVDGASTSGTMGALEDR